MIQTIISLKFFFYAIESTELFIKKILFLIIYRNKTGVT